MINRRQLLTRDEPVIWKEIFTQIRRAGYSTSEICFVLNVPRGTLSHWEHDGIEPKYEDGRAILKLHSSCPLLDALIKKSVS